MTSEKSNDELNVRFKVLSFEYPGYKAEVYLLNVGDCFYGFGGSSSGLVVRKTASLITREMQHGWKDQECNLGDQNTWRWIDRNLRTQGKLEILEDVKNAVQFLEDGGDWMLARDILKAAIAKVEAL